MTPPRLRLLRISRNILLGLVAVVVLVLIGIYFLLRASLPKLDGEVSLASLSSSVTLSRDERGTVQIAARDMSDAMRALGFVHAQERFFEMDLARRSAAGELSALLGGATLKVDKEKRQHRLRARMETAWKSLPPAERESVSSYTAGVNAGLTALGTRPWQYFLLRTNPERVVGFGQQGKHLNRCANLGENRTVINDPKLFGFRVKAQEFPVGGSNPEMPGLVLKRLIADHVDLLNARRSPFKNTNRLSDNNGSH